MIASQRDIGGHALPGMTQPQPQPEPLETRTGTRVPLPGQYPQTNALDLYGSAASNGPWALGAVHRKAFCRGMHVAGRTDNSMLPQSLFLPHGVHNLIASFFCYSSELYFWMAQIERISRTEAVKLDVPSSVSSLARNLQNRAQSASSSSKVSYLHQDDILSLVICGLCQNTYS